MTTDTYFINPLVTMVKDGIDPAHEDLIMQVYSGDYFATLATRLDLLLQDLPMHSASRDILQKTVNDLLYLQEHYEII